MNKDWTVLTCQNFLDVSDYVEDPPTRLIPEPGAVPIISGKSSGRYNHPKLKPLYYECKNILEYILGEKLYPTYYYDRFYFNLSKMKRHTDRPACEISVSLNISSNLKKPWPIYFETDDGEIDCVTSPGDAVVYKGIEVPHWRNQMNDDKKSYFHQMFLHFVRADGHYLEYAYDRRD